MLRSHAGQKQSGHSESPKRDVRRNPSGFTLIEVLLAVTITALLLAAIATAMHASLMSYTENEKSASVTQTARSVINRLVRDVRTAQAVNSGDNLLVIIPPDDGSGVTEIHYEFSEGQLLYRTISGGPMTTYVLIDSPEEADRSSAGVTSFDVLREIGQVWDGNDWVDCTKSVTVRLVLDVDGQPFGVTATAAPRRNQTY